MRRRTLLFSAVIIATFGCQGPKGDPGASAPCSVTDNGDGTATMRCPDGTVATLATVAPVHDAGELLDSHAIDATPRDAFATPDGFAVDGRELDSSANLDAYVLPDVPVTDSEGQDRLASDATTGDGSASNCCEGIDPAFVVEGSYTITNTLDARALNGMRCITGRLQVAAEGMVSLALNSLTRVCGMVQISASTIETVSLPALITVGDKLQVDCAALASVNLTALESTGRGLMFFPNRLETLVLPRYRSSLGVQGPLSSVQIPELVNGDVAISGTLFTSIELPRFTGGNLIVGSPNLAMVSVPLMTSGNVVISGKFAQLSLPVLTIGNLTVNSSSEASVTAPMLQSGDVRIYGQVTSLSVPAMTDGSLDLLSTALASVSAPLLSSAGDIRTNACAPSLSLSFPELQSARYVQFTCTGLTALSMAKLSRVTDYVQVSGTGLTDLVLPQLISIGATPGVDNCGSWGGGTSSANAQVDDNLHLANISLPMLATVQSLAIASNAALTSISLPSLGKRDVVIRSNPLLPACAVADLQRNIGCPSGAHFNFGNLNPCQPSTCPVTCVNDCSELNDFRCEAPDAAPMRPDAAARLDTAARQDNAMNQDAAVRQDAGLRPDVMSFD